MKQAKVFPFPHTDQEYIQEDLKNKKSTVEHFPFLKIDETQKLIIVQPGVHKVDKDLIIPPGYKVLATTASSIDIVNKAKIISYAPLFFSGNDEDDFVITSSDFTGQGIELINAPGSVFRNVLFKNIPEAVDQQWKRSGYITCYESKITLEHCHFINSKAKSIVNLIRSEYSINKTLFQDATGDALDIDFSKGTISNSSFENCKTAIKANSSNVDLMQVQFIKVIKGVDPKSSAIRVNGKLIQSDK
jgi:hypothetical protein